MKTTIDIQDQLLRILGDDGHLLDGFEMICEVIDDGSCHDVDQKAHESSIGADQNEGKEIDNDIESDQKVGQTIILAGFLRNLRDDDLGENLRTIDTTTILQDQGQPQPKDRTTEGNGDEVLRMNDNLDVFEDSKADGVDSGAEKGFQEERSTEQEPSGNQEGKEDHKNGEGEVKASHLADEDGNTSSTIINGCIGKQNAGDGKTCQQSSQGNHDPG